MDDILQQVKTFISPLSFDAHKGEGGRVGVIGGSRDYSGAPFYSAISALKTGADLSHIFCCESASSAIKSYSPEVIVHPYLIENNDVDPASRSERSKHAVEDVRAWFQGIRVFVIGPGLGRDSLVWKTVSEIVEQAKGEGIPLVIDGDGINMICENLDLIRGYNKVVLTPNVVEFKRLCSKVFEEKEKRENGDLKDLCNRLGNITVVLKSKEDLICNGENEPVKCKEEGSPRRCGGQGDILTGVLATFLGWASEWEKKQEK